MNSVTTLIIGAGQSGLAMSKHLTDRSIDHVLIERGEIANSWQKERWDSLRLLTPNWQSRLPGSGNQGSNPDGYMTMHEVVRFLQHFADLVRAPVKQKTLVTRVVQADPGYRVTTDRGEWRCRNACACERRLQHCRCPSARGRTAAKCSQHDAGTISQSAGAAGWQRDDRGRVGQRRTACQ